MTFEETYLNDNILDALYDMRFEEMTPIQEKCIPEMLNGRDVLGVAQTGTGKTAAYLLPILSMLDDGYVDFPDGRHIEFPQEAINCVIMAPTRELAQQIDQAMQGFGYYLPNVSSVAVYGGNDGNRYYQAGTQCPEDGSIGHYRHTGTIHLPPDDGQCRHVESEFLRSRRG